MLEKGTMMGKVSEEMRLVTPFSAKVKSACSCVKCKLKVLQGINFAFIIIIMRNERSDSFCVKS